MTSPPGTASAPGTPARRRTALLSVGIVLALIAGQEAACKSVTLPDIGQVPAFSLLDHEGADFSEQRLRGRVWLASFLYTSCPGPCPVLVARLADLRRRVAPEALAMVSFSVDPDTDTVEVLRAYASAHGIEASRSWWLATGPREEILTLIRNGFLSAVSQEAEDTNSASGPILHSTRLLLIDGDGRIRGTYSSDDSEDLTRLEEDAKTLSSHSPSKRD